jgi:hypothetical protein
MYHHFLLRNVAVIALTALVAISCNKEEVPATTSINPTKSMARPDEGTKPYACCRSYVTTHEESADGGICCEGGTTCLICVVVAGTPAVFQVTEELHDLIGKGPKEVGGYFSASDRYLELLPSLAKEEHLLRALRNGEYVIEDIITGENAPSAILFAPVEKNGKSFAIPYLAVK